MPAPGRLLWVDAARGYCVAAVVLFHVVLWHYRSGVDAAPVGDALWAEVNSLLGSVRMPVLLAVSGLVLAGRIRRGSARITWVRSYYLYVVWLAVYAVFYALLQQPYLQHRVDGLEVLVQLGIPNTTLWYLFALAAYTLVLSHVRRVPPWVVLAVLTVLSVLMHSQRFPGQLWAKVPELFVFFAIGVYGAESLRRLAQRATLVRAGLALVAAAGITVLGRFLGEGLGDASLFVVRGASFMVLCVLAVAVAVRWAPVRDVGVWLGRQTLAVYVMHPLWIALLIVATRGFAGDAIDAVVGTAVGALVYPAVVTAVVVALSIGLRHALTRVGLGFCFEVPAAWRAALSPARPVPSAGPATGVVPGAGPATGSEPSAGPAASAEPSAVPVPGART